MRLKRVLVLLAIFIALPRTQFAQTNYVVAPNDKEHSFGNSFAAIFTADFQQLYSPSHFSMVTSIVAITGIGLRWDGTINQTNITLRSVLLQMGTCAVSSLNFEQNLGPNPVRVFSGTNVTFPITPNRSPAVFDLHFTFQKPFYYQPAAGFLVLQGEPSFAPADADAEQMFTDGVTIYRDRFTGHVYGSSTVVVTKFFYRILPQITSVAKVNANLSISFRDATGEARLASSGNAVGPYNIEVDAEIVPTSFEHWEAKVPVPAVPRFYRILLQ